MNWRKNASSEATATAHQRVPQAPLANRAAQPVGDFVLPRALKESKKLTATDGEMNKGSATVMDIVTPNAYTCRHLRRNDELSTEQLHSDALEPSLPKSLRESLVDLALRT